MLLLILGCKWLSGKKSQSIIYISTC